MLVHVTVHVRNSLIAGDIHIFELFMKSVMCDNVQKVLDNTTTAFLAFWIYSILQFMFFPLIFLLIMLTL